MPWQLLFLAEFDEDLQALSKAHGLDPTEVEERIREHFEDRFKAARLAKFLTSGAATGAVDRLATSEYPPSIRLQIMHDLRVTAWCFPSQKHAVVTHIFHKSQDPNYKAAVNTRDKRLSAYVESLHGFMEKKKRKWPSPRLEYARRTDPAPVAGGPRIPTAYPLLRHLQPHPCARRHPTREGASAARGTRLRRRGAVRRPGLTSAFP